MFAMTDSAQKNAAETSKTAYKDASKSIETYFTKYAAEARKHITEFTMDKNSIFWMM